MIARWGRTLIVLGGLTLLLGATLIAGIRILAPPTTVASDPTEAQRFFDHGFTENCENALRDYIAAGELIAPEWIDHRDLIQRVLDEGWGEEAELLEDLIGRSRPALGRAREGFGRPAWYSFPESSISVEPEVDFLAFRHMGELNRLEGRRLEAEGRHGEALDLYLDLLAIGCDLGVAGAGMIHRLIMTAMVHAGAESIEGLVAGGHLEEAEIEQARERLVQLRRRLSPIDDMFLVDRMAQYRMIDRIMQADDLKSWVTKRMMFGRVRSDLDRWFDLHQGFFEIPYHQRDYASFHASLKTAKERSGRMSQIIIPHYLEAEGRILQDWVNLDRLLLAIELELYRRRHGGYPGSLEALVPERLEAIPIDPFGGAPYRYRTGEDGRYTLWSVGPDAADGGGLVPYDPTNGTISGGDVFRRHPFGQ